MDTSSRGLGLALVALAAAACLVLGCADRMRKPEVGWIATDNAAERAVRGADIDLVLKRPRQGEHVDGEFIAYFADTLHVLTSEGLESVHRKDVASSRLIVTPVAGQSLRIMNPHRRLEDRVRFESRIGDYARFPAGLPPGLDRSAIVPLARRPDATPR